MRAEAPIPAKRVVEGLKRRPYRSPVVVLPRSSPRCHQPTRQRERAALKVPHRLGSVVGPQVPGRTVEGEAVPSLQADKSLVISGVQALRGPPGPIQEIRTCI